MRRIEVTGCDQESCRDERYNTWGGEETGYGVPTRD